MAGNTTTNDVGPWTDFQQAAPAQTSGPWEDFQGSAPAKQPFTVMDTWPVRLAKSLYNAATLPGDVYKGNAAVPQSANMPGGEDTSSIGRVTDLASLASPVSAGGKPAAIAPPTPAQYKAAATTDYKQALKAPIELTTDALRAFKNQVENDFYNDGITDVHAPVTFKLLDKFSNPPEGAVGVTPTNLRAIQKSLGVIKNKNTDPTERMVAGSVLNQFNSLLENLDQVPSAISSGTPQAAADFSNLVKEANANYSTYKTAQAFDRRGANAEIQANASHSGMNLENNLRSQVAQILKNPSLQRGMDADTIQALKDFNAGSRTANTMRFLGNIMGGGGGLGMLASGAVSHALGLPFEAGPAVGYALKSLANNRAANQFGRIGDTILANGPLAQQGVTSLRPYSPLATRIPFLTMPMLGVSGGLAPTMPLFGIQP